MGIYINEKIYFFSLTTIMSTTKRKYRWETKNKRIINKIEKKEYFISISSAKEISHRVVGGVAVGAGGVFSPAYGLAVGLETRAIAGSELGEGISERPGQQLFGWANWRRSGHEHFVGCLRPDDLLYHPPSWSPLLYHPPSWSPLLMISSHDLLSWSHRWSPLSPRPYQGVGPSFSTMDGKNSHSNIFTTGQSSEMGR